MKHIAIYQIKIDENNNETLCRAFASLSTLKRMNKTFNPNFYTKVFEGDMDVENVEDVYIKLQGTKPQGFKGHSLSVSDLVQMDGKLFFCDSYGFVDKTNVWKLYTFRHKIN